MSLRALLPTLLAALLWMAGPVAAQEPYRLGAIFSITGPGSSLGIPERDGIVEESEAAGADLIALAVHRPRGVARVLGGGMVRRLQRATTIPLLVVPAPERAAA
jgi:hypothetical protein